MSGSRLVGMRLNLLAGLLIGGFGVGLTLILHAAGQLRAPLGGRLSALALAVHAGVLVWALVLHRRAGSPEPVPFSRLLGAGLLISLVAGVVLFVGALVFTTAVDPGHLPWLRETMTAELERWRQDASASGVSAAETAAETTDPAEPALSPEELAAQRRAIEDLTPGSYALQWLGSALFTGLLLTLPIATLLRIGALRRAPQGSS